MESERYNYNGDVERRRRDFDRRQAQERYERTRRRSTSGGSARRNRNNRIVVDAQKFKRAIIGFAATVAVSVSLVIGGGNAAIHDLQDGIYMGQLQHDFQVEVISPETHRTNDNEHYFFDYSDIASHIEDMDNFDQGVYLFNASEGDYQTGQVLAYTDYGSFSNYLEARGYENSDEFRADMRERILLEAEIDKKEDELQRMNSEHPETVTYEYGDHTKGGM